MSIQEELNRLTKAKIDIKGALDRLGVECVNDKLEGLADALGTIQKVEAKQESGVIKIPVGYISEEQTFVVSSDLSTGYLINGEDGNVYFQAVKIVNGEAVADGDPVKITGLDIPNIGDIDPVYPPPAITEELVTGYIVNNEDGSVCFQQVEVSDSGITPSGEPTQISEVKIVDTGAPEPEYQTPEVDSGAGSASLLYRCATVDTDSKRWSGFPAELNDGIYSISEELVEDLNYTDILPEVGEVYPNGASFKVAFLNTGKPSDYVFFDSLSSSEGWDMYGLSVVTDEKRSVFQSVNDGSGAQYAIKTENPGVPLGNDPRTLSFWFKRIGYNGSTGCGIGYGTSGANQRIAWGLVDDYPGVTYWANDYFQSSVGKTTDTGWHHWAVTYDGTKTECFMDGHKVWTWGTSSINTTWQYINVGDPWESYQSNGRYADYYIFPRALKEHEIAMLYADRTV